MALLPAVLHRTSDTTGQLRCHSANAKLVLLINRAFIKEDYRRDMNMSSVMYCLCYILASKGLASEAEAQLEGSVGVSNVYI